MGNERWRGFSCHCFRGFIEQRLMMYELIHMLLNRFWKSLTNLFQVSTKCRMRCGMCSLVELPRLRIHRSGISWRLFHALVTVFCSWMSRCNFSQLLSRLIWVETSLQRWIIFGNVPSWNTLISVSISFEKSPTWVRWQNIKFWHVRLYISFDLKLLNICVY